MYVSNPSGLEENDLTERFMQPRIFLSTDGINFFSIENGALTHFANIESDAFSNAINVGAYHYFVQLRKILKEEELKPYYTYEEIIDLDKQIKEDKKFDFQSSYTRSLTLD